MLGFYKRNNKTARNVLTNKILTNTLNNATTLMYISFFDYIAFYFVFLTQCLLLLSTWRRPCVQPSCAWQDVW